MSGVIVMHGPSRSMVGLLAAALALVSGVWAGGPEQPGPERHRLDCGVNTLYLLHQSLGRPTTLEQLDALLPPRNAAGYSMAELARASRAAGVALEGVELDRRRGLRFSQPAIAYLHHERGGHFVLIRPVGTRGGMVQVIDPPRVPRVVDAGALAYRPGWTGRVLRPRPPWYRQPLPAVGLAAVVLGAAVWRLRAKPARQADP
jgi:hypothetical protein